jgi:hypothetical protein
VDRDALRKTPLFARAVDILRTCEELRHANAFDEAAKARLRDPGQEFALFKNADGKMRFRQIRSHAQTIAMAEPWTREWIVTNSFAAQPVTFRLEALMSAVPATDSNAVLVADLAREAGGLWKHTNADGVNFTVQPSADPGDPRCVMSATSAGKVPRNAAWARLEKHFAPPLNAKEGKALALEIESDGSGAVLVIRLESPQHLAYGAVADRYVTLDFAGRRQLTLVETESSRWNDYVWNDGKHLYGVYREAVNFGAIESVSVWLQNLPPGKPVKCRVGPIQALPMRAAPVKDPAVTVNGVSIVFPVEMPSGSWIECNGPDDCALYGSKGELISKVTPRGGWPTLRAGENRVQFSCPPQTGPSPRAKVTVFSHGEPL